MNNFWQKIKHITESLDPMERDTIVLHSLFTVLCMIVLLIPVDVPIGLRMLFLVTIYNLSVPAVGLWRGYSIWVDLWLFVFILSIFQVWPDWFLSAQLDILVFPDDGFLKIGPVSAYMAGLWTIPLFIIVFLGLRVHERYSQNAAYGIVGLASLLIFGASEQTLWLLPSWYAQNVAMIGHMAIYIIIPELILGLTTYVGYQLIQNKPSWKKILLAFVIMLLYLGSAVFFYFVIERLLLGL
ncbi:MAG: DUF6989 domain-containing protein [Candidatus Hermodarchaeota archaeon]